MPYKEHLKIPYKKHLKILNKKTWKPLMKKTSKFLFKKIKIKGQSVWVRLCVSKGLGEGVGGGGRRAFKTLGVLKRC